MINGSFIFAFVIASCCLVGFIKEAYFIWRRDKWRELTGISWDECYDIFDEILDCWNGTDFSTKITNSDFDCGRIYFYVNNVKFKLEVNKHSINSWKEYREYKKDNVYFSLYFGKKKLAVYTRLDDFITEFPTMCMLYVKQSITKDRLSKLQDDFND